ncbi:MAG: glycosyltransferase family 39 protein [Candidatus Omnitrophota bacterium]
MRRFWKDDDWEEPSPAEEAEASSDSASFLAWPGWLKAIYIEFLLLSLLMAILLSIRADGAGRPCLQFCEPFIQWIVAAKKWMVIDSAARASWLGWGLAGLAFFGAAIGLARKKEEAVRPFFLFTAGCLAILAQTSYFLGNAFRGGLFYALSLMILIVWRFLPPILGPDVDFYPDREDESDEPPAPQRLYHFILEFLGLAVLTLLTIVFRFYSLNQLPTIFDGEMAASMAVATDLPSAFKLNYEPMSPFGWAPLGLVYFLLINASTQICGMTLLAVRIVSAVVGVLLVQLLYGLLRRMGGRTAAFIGAALFAFSSIEIVWGRHDFFPLSYPSLIAAALCWTTYLALVKEKFRNFFLTALWMGLTYHLFPSGQTAFLIPIGVMLWSLLTVRGFARRCWGKCSLIAIGGALWFAGLSISAYLADGVWKWINPLSNAAVSKGTLRGHALWTAQEPGWGLWGRISYIAGGVWDNFTGVIKSLFTAMEWPQYRYTPIYGIPDHPMTYIPAVAAVLLFVGLIVCLLAPRRRNCAFLLIWMIAALLPGILSSQAEARRIAFFFPAVYAAAALAAAKGFEALEFLLGRWTGRLARLFLIPSFLVGLAILHGGIYFDQDKRFPPATQTAAAISHYVKPGSFVVLDFAIDNPYRLINEITFTMLDELSRPDRPAIWHVAEPHEWPLLAVYPKPDFEKWYYHYSKMKKIAPELRANPSWNRLTYIVHDIPANEKKIAILQGIYPDAFWMHHLIYPLYDFYSVETRLDSQSAEDRLRPIAVVEGDCSFLPEDRKDWWRGVDCIVEEKASETPIKGAALNFSAGLWIREQRWLAFRILGGGEGAAFNLNGQPAPLDEFLPLTDGINRLEIRLPHPANLPIVLQSRGAGSQNYEDIAASNLVSPQLSDVGPLKPLLFSYYEGYGAPQTAAAGDAAFAADFAVSPAGCLAMLHRGADSWKVRVTEADGAVAAEWEHPLVNHHHEPRYGVCFIGNDEIAVLDSPKVFLYDVRGNLEKEFDLPIDPLGGVDIAANLDGELFAASVDQHCVFYFRKEWSEFKRLAPQAKAGDREWNPRWLSFAARQLAVLDDREHIQLFENIVDDPLEYRWKKEIPLQFNLGSDMENALSVILFQMSGRGWFYLRFLREKEFRVLDEKGVRRFASAPEGDLSILLQDRCRQIIGFDSGDRLYVWDERACVILRLEPIGNDLEDQEKM